MVAATNSIRALI